MTQYSAAGYAKHANRPAHGESKEAQHAIDTFTIAVAPVVNDTINLVRLPAWARVIGIAVTTNGQVDSGSAFALTVGDAGFGTSGQAGYVAGDTARYLTATTIGRSAGVVDANSIAVMNGRAQSFLNAQTQPLTVFATVTAAPGTFVAGAILTARVAYFVDEPGSLLNQ